MITYAETLGNKPFDWNGLLRKKTITDSQWAEAIERASNWENCSCGTQSKHIERLSDGRPEDEMLSNLGGGKGFYLAIKEKNKTLALALLNAVEIRSAELVAIEKKKLTDLLAEFD